MTFLLATLRGRFRCSRLIRHILVTGGSGGLGQHFARFLANNGAHITVAPRRAEALAENVAEIIGSGGKAQSVVLDVTLAAQVRWMSHAQVHRGRGLWLLSRLF
jgi:NAD(P)-dependent dehydrogenase (short-subunit alcohol dehydrogenase family)